jgi:alkyldihydroxyacetonephosphate synthase
MRRWNGWGDTSVVYHLPAGAHETLEQWVGQATPPVDADFDQVVAGVPDTRLPDHPLVDYSPAGRLLHARGQSLPDWVALRSGRIGVVPDGVAYPESSQDVLALLRFSREVDARVIPYGGGSSVVGHINPLPGTRPVLTVDMRRMNRLQRFQPTSMLATFGAGVNGPELEAQLRAHGSTLGHYPQSFEFSTLGGWVATRSAGQQAFGYGRTEAFFAGGRLETPLGTMNLPAEAPASASGPDLRELVLGSEGRLGILTDVTVRVHPLPAKEQFWGVFFPDFAAGSEAVREMAQIGLPLSMLRLSTATETRTTLLLAGHERLIQAMERMLSLRNVREQKALLLLGASGSERTVRAARREALDVAGVYGGVNLGSALGNQWQKGRFHYPYLRNTLWEMGYAVDTLESATSWDCVPQLIQAVEEGLRHALHDEGERVYPFTHLSHIYSSGSSVYTTFLFRQAPDPETTLRRWRRLKQVASEAILANRGTISHQHGVGIDHAIYLPAEKGELGMSLLRALGRELDPDAMMNPGKLFDDRGGSDETPN